MARRIEFTAQYQHPVETVHATLTSERYWQEFIAKAGGTNAELVSFSSDDSGTTATLKQFIARDKLPAVVQKAVKNDMVIVRVIQFGPLNGTFAGNSKSTMEGRPKDGITTNFTIAPSGDAAEAAVTMEAAVGIPIIGGQLEKILLQNMESLVTQEAKWTSKWITENA